MPGLRAGMGLASLILIAGSIVLMFFVVLSGVTNSTPLNKTYFLQANTGSISGARPVSQWTYFYICGADNQDCGSTVPALPFGYAWDSNPTGAPADLVGKYGHHTTSYHYYYMWRFGWAFYLIALVFNVLAFFTSLLAPISRLASGLSGLIIGTALFFFTFAASLMTVTFVEARDRFKHAGMSAKVGRYAFGFTWGAWACMFLATVMLFLGCGLGGRRDKAPTTTTRGTGGVSSRNFFRRRRSRPSARGSFVDNESQRRVKDEYA